MIRNHGNSGIGSVVRDRLLSDISAPFVTRER
jgi:hypothetical protein